MDGSEQRGNHKMKQKKQHDLDERSEDTSETRNTDAVDRKIPSGLLLLDSTGGNEALPIIQVRRILVSKTNGSADNTSTNVSSIRIVMAEHEQPAVLLVVVLQP